VGSVKEHSRAGPPGAYPPTMLPAREAFTRRLIARYPGHQWRPWQLSLGQGLPPDFPSMIEMATPRQEAHYQGHPDAIDDQARYTRRIDQPL
jgi:hypothetical protein